jgi:hypothetical protein
MLYGISPLSSDGGEFGGYEPVVKAIRGRVIHVGTPERGRVGVVPIGLADGSPAQRVCEKRGASERSSR